MTRKVVLIGNCLVGDALWCWKHFLPEPGVHKTAFCIPYNKGTVDVFRELTTLQVDDVVVHPDAEANVPFSSLADYETWCEKYVQREDGVIYQHFAANHDLTPMPVTRAWEPGGDYVTLQLDSFHGWKRCVALKPAAEESGWVCKTIAESGHDIVGEAIINRPLPDVARLLLGAKCHVGINSSITVLAMLLGVPTVLCNFGDVGYWSSVPNYVRILITPGVPEIQKAVEEVTTHASVQRGVEQAERGAVHDLGSFDSYTLDRE